MTLPRPCLHPGCPALVTDASRCPRHAAEREQHYEQQRGSSAARGYGAAHRTWRTVILARDPVCRLCHRAPSTVADHIMPLRLGGTWALSNGQGVCAHCHAVKRGQERHQ